MKNLHISSIVRHTGKETDSIIAKATYRNARIEPVYNVLTGNLQINGEWYFIPDAELSDLLNVLAKTFNNMC